MTNMERMEIQRNSAEVLYNLGVGHADEGQHEEAVDAYTSALTIQPDYLSAHMRLILSLLVLCRVSEAEAQCRALRSYDMELADSLTRVVEQARHTGSHSVLC